MSEFFLITLQSPRNVIMNIRLLICSVKCCQWSCPAFYSIWLLSVIDSSTVFYGLLNLSYISYSTLIWNWQLTGSSPGESRLDCCSIKIHNRKNLGNPTVYSVLGHAWYHNTFPGPSVLGPTDLGPSLPGPPKLCCLLLSSWADTSCTDRSWTTHSWFL